MATPKFPETEGSGAALSDAEMFRVSVKQQALTRDQWNFQQAAHSFKSLARNALNERMTFEHRGPNGCGEGCLAVQPRRMSTVTAMTECMIMRLEKTSIIRVLRDEPGFSEIFISHLLAQTIRVEEDLVDQLFKLQ
jgi:hypothetical protein